MAVKLLSESMDATITDDDQIRISRVLTFWFKEHELTAPQIDGRMEIWFGENPAFDHEIEREFSADVEAASGGKLDHWARQPQGRLALILLIDQFRRNIYRGTAKAFEKDKGLTPIQRVFFYMPLQHAESRKVQAKSVEIYRKLADAVGPTYRETFETVVQFAELHRDIVERFGRFPHRNKVLGRKNTPEEEEYLAGDDTLTFGQG